MRVMEMMWDIPLSRNHWPNQCPDLHHVQPFYKPFEPKSQTLQPALTQDGKFCPGPRKKEQKDLSEKEDPFTVKLQMCFKRKIPDRRSEESERKKKIPDQRSEEKKREGNSRPKIRRKQKKRKKGNSQSKIGRRQGSEQKGLQTRQYLNKIQKCHEQERKERKL